MERGRMDASSIRDATGDSPPRIGQQQQLDTCGSRPRINTWVLPSLLLGGPPPVRLTVPESLGYYFA
jgi:hypothetical protein